MFFKIFFVYILIGIFIFITISTLPFYFVGIFMQAPFVPTSQKMVEKLLKLTNFKDGDHIIELGSGDGRFLRTAGKKFTNITGIGYEWIWWLPILSNKLAKKEKIFPRIKFERANFFDKDLSNADWVVIYLMPNAMPKVLKKLKSELKTGTKILSHAFPIDGLKLIKELPKDEIGTRVFLYEI